MAWYSLASTPTPQDPHEADNAKTAEGSGLLRRAPGGRRVLCKLSHEARLTRAMTTKARRVPGGRQAGAERRFPLWCKGGRPHARSPEESSKGFYSGATIPRPPGRHDGGHHRAHRRVTTRGFLQAKTTFVRIGCTTCPLSNPAIVESLPAHILEEDQGHYI